MPFSSHYVRDVNIQMSCDISLMYHDISLTSLLVLTFPCLSTSSHSDSLPQNAIHLLNCSIPAVMYGSVRIIDPYPPRKQLYQLAYDAYVQLLLLLVLQPLLIFKVTRLAPLSPSVRWFHAYVIQLECFVTSCVLSRMPWAPLSDFFLICIR